jgi:hypothetical protein
MRAARMPTNSHVGFGPLTQTRRDAMQTTYIKSFSSENAAYAYMIRINRAHPHAEPYVMIDGPSDDYAVVDMSTAIELNAMYRWEA